MNACQMKKKGPVLPEVPFNRNVQISVSQIAEVILKRVWLLQDRFPLVEPEKKYIWPYCVQNFTLSILISCF